MSTSSTFLLLGAAEEDKPFHCIQAACVSSDVSCTMVTCISTRQLCLLCMCVHAAIKAAPAPALYTTEMKLQAAFLGGFSTAGSYYGNKGKAVCASYISKRENNATPLCRLVIVSTDATVVAVVMLTMTGASQTSTAADSNVVGVSATA